MKLYLASPYSHPDPNVRHERFIQVNRVAGKLMRQNHIVFSPISHSHPIHLIADLPGDWAFWERQDRAFIEWCDCLCVLTADGWEESKGVRAEIKIAKEMGKDVQFFNVKGNRIAQAALARGRGEG